MDQLRAKHLKAVQDAGTAPPAGSPCVAAPCRAHDFFTGVGRMLRCSAMRALWRAVLLTVQGGGAASAVCTDAVLDVTLQLITIALHSCNNVIDTSEEERVAFYANIRVEAVAEAEAAAAAEVVAPSLLTRATPPASYHDTFILGTGCI